MKQTLIAIALLISFCAHTQNKQKNGAFKECHTNGNLKVSGYYKDNKKVAHWQYYWDNGKLKKESAYGQHGVWTGYSRRYSKDGVLLAETKPKTDSSVEQIHYFANGEEQRVFVLVSFGEKQRYLKHGTYTSYYRDQTLKIKSEYVKDELSGVWTQYYKTGEKEWEVLYKDGYKQGAYQKFYKNGQLQIEGHHVLGLKSGIEQQFDTTGNLSHELKYRKGILKKPSNFPKSAIVVVPDGVVQKSPIYPGCGNNIGNKAMKNCMTKKISEFVVSRFNNTFAKETHLQGNQKIYVIFKIDEKGNVIDIRARAKHKALEAEAIRVLALLPKMTPGYQYGKPAKAPYSLPIIFKI